MQSSTGAQKLAEQVAEFTSAERVKVLTLQRLESESHVGQFGRHDEAFDRRLTGFLANEGGGADRMGVEDQIAYLGEHQDLQDKFAAAEAKYYGANLASTRERIAHLQKNKELGQEFARPENLHMETLPEGFARQLILNPQSEVGQLYEKMLAGGIVSGDEARGYARRSLANIEADPAIRAQRAELAATNTAKLALMADTEGAESARARMGTRETLHAAGETGIRLHISEMSLEIAMLARRWLGTQRTQAEMEAAMIRRKIEELEHPGQTDGLGLRDSTRTGRSPTEDETTQAGILREYLHNLEQRNAQATEEAEERRHAQAERHHRENQTTARQNGARVQAAKPRGRE